MVRSPIHHVPSSHVSPACTPYFTNPSVGTPAGFYITEEMWRVQQACEEERDGMSYAMYEQQQDMMEFMCESQRQHE